MRLFQWLPHHNQSDAERHLKQRLFDAALRGYTVAVREILAHGLAVDCTLDARDDLARYVRPELAEINGVFKPEGWTPLMMAAFWGHQETVQELLTHNADICAVSAFHWTALTLAAERGHVVIVQQLLDAGADPNELGAYTFTALHQAALKGYPEVARLLLQWGAKVDARAEGGITPLMLAARMGQSDCVTALIEANADMSAQNDNGATALFEAAYHRRDTVVQQLRDAGAQPSLEEAAMIGDEMAARRALENGADVNRKGYDTISPLMWAAEYGQERLVRALLEYGADTTQISKAGWTALEYAAKGGDPEITTLLLLRETQETHLRNALVCAAEEDHTDVARRLLSRIVPDAEALRTALAAAAAHNSPNVIPLLLAAVAALPERQSLLDAALLQAVQNRAYEAARALLEGGAQVNARNADGETPLRAALRLEAGPEMVRLLLAYRADVQESDPHGERITALAKDNVEIVRMLAQAGAELGLRQVVLLGDVSEAKHLLLSREGARLGHHALGELLSVACAQGHYSMAQLLIDAGADVQARSSDGFTPLLAAVRGGQTKLARLLLERGADIRATLSGTTALHLAARSNNLEMAQLLLAHGADVNAEDRYGDTPWMLALQKNYHEMSALLHGEGVTT